MLTVMLVALVLSKIEFRLETGARVEISYSHQEMTETDASRAGLSIAKAIWNDFCGVSEKSKCGSGQSYLIDIGLQKGRFRFCDASIAYTTRDAFPSEKNPSKSTWGHYICRSNEHDSDFHVLRDTSQ